jgi:hypothetical protein
MFLSAVAAFAVFVELHWAEAGPMSTRETSPRVRAKMPMERVI